jgi:predicted nucleic acid-binding protein
VKRIIVDTSAYSAFMRGHDEVTTALREAESIALNPDEDTADRYALIVDSLRSAGTPIPTNDIWIAASAMQHGLGVLTTDDHFGRVRQIAVMLHQAG